MLALDALQPIALPHGVRLLQRGWLSANSIVHVGDDREVSVVDTGYVSHAPQTVDLLERAMGPATLGRVINTHLHSDHCGGNAALLARWPSATITVPNGYRSAVDPWNEDRLSFRETGQRCMPFRVDHFLRAGEEVRLSESTWEVHAAPGHDPEALMFFEPRTRTLISGDALWEHRLAIIFPELHGQNGFGLAFQALDSIERLAPRIVLPGHGSAFTDVATALSQSRQRLERFARLPQRHRDHAVRALIICHMLEYRERTWIALTHWVATTPIFRTALNCVEGHRSATELADRVVASLLNDGLLESDGWIVRIPDHQT